MYLSKLYLILVLGVLSQSTSIRYVPIDSHDGTIYSFICMGNGSTLLFKYNGKTITTIYKDDLVDQLQYIRNGNTSGCLYIAGLLSSNNASELVAVLVAYDCQNSSFEITCSNQEQSEVVHTAERNGLHSSPIDTDFSVNIVLDHLFTENIIHRSNKTLLTHVFSCLVNQTFISIKVNDIPPYGFDHNDRIGLDRTTLSDDGSFIREVAILLRRRTGKIDVLLLVTSSNHVTVTCSSTSRYEASLTVNNSYPLEKVTSLSSATPTPYFTQQDNATTANVDNDNSSDLGIILGIVIPLVAAICFVSVLVGCYYFCPKRLCCREDITLPRFNNCFNNEEGNSVSSRDVSAENGTVSQSAGVKIHQDQQEIGTSSSVC